mmetsp:Transcript_5269/g.7733  ORF Transcript_5269/g.7733 Transcript_5269/m.7733 type:complete len:218 (-) Transcript_5269:2352-3005(-)
MADRPISSTKNSTSHLSHMITNASSSSSSITTTSAGDTVFTSLTMLLVLSLLDLLAASGFSLVSFSRSRSLLRVDFFPAMAACISMGVASFCGTDITGRGATTSATLRLLRLASKTVAVFTSTTTTGTGAASMTAAPLPLLATGAATTAEGASTAAGAAVAPLARLQLRILMGTGSFSTIVSIVFLVSTGSTGAGTSADPRFLLQLRLLATVAASLA